MERVATKECMQVATLAGYFVISVSVNLDVRPMVLPIVDEGATRYCV